MKEKERSSNYELMRIISMIMIVTGHLITHGNMLNNCTNMAIKRILEFIFDTLVIHVNSFILLTGYFQSTNKFKQSKLWSLINSSLFYRAGIMLGLFLLFNVSFDKATIIRKLFILNLDEYWFIKLYIFIYILSPFLNILISKLKQKQYNYLLIIMFTLFSVLPYLTGCKAFDNNGYTLYNFIFLYLIGAYIRKYPIKQWYIFNKIPDNLYKILLYLSFIFIIIINFSIEQTTNIMRTYSPVYNEIFGGVYNMTRAYSNPFVIIQTVIYFSIFGTLNIKSNFINKLSKLTMGVYLIHDNSMIRYNIYKVFKITPSIQNSYQVLLYLIIVTVIIYVVCSIVEYIRQLIFKIVYNFKISQKIRNKYYGFLEKCKV